MTEDISIKIEQVSKKYCRSLKDTMLFGLQDISRNAIGVSSQSQVLRKGEFWALDDVSFEVNKGETIGVIGLNGSGKTTLLKLLNGIFMPDKGHIEINGRTGALIEVGAGFHPLLTGRENIYVNGTIMGMSKKEIDEKIDTIIDFADIKDFIDLPVKNYSSGMYVRLGFSVAVHSDADILLIDEVLAVGDARFQLKCFRKIADFKASGKTIILVTHNMEAVLNHANRVVLLDNGRISCIDTPKNTVNKYLELISTGFENAKLQKKGASAFDMIDEKIMLGPAVTDIDSEQCKKRASYNKNEFRYGNAKARIVDFELLNSEGKETSHIKSTDSFAFRFKVRFYEDIEHPVFGLTVKTKDGVELYGYNTLYKDMNIGPQVKGAEVWAEFLMRCNLQAGDYFLTAGIVDLVADKIVPLDRRYDLAHMVVLPIDKSYGIINLQADIKVQ